MWTTSMHWQKGNVDRWFLFLQDIKKITSKIQLPILKLQAAYWNLIVLGFSSVQ